MMNKTLRDIVVCSAIILVAAIAYFKAAQLPPGRYDPLGGGSMPKMVAATIIVLSLAAIADALFRDFAARRAGTARPAAADPGHPWSAVLVFACAAAAAISIGLRVPYWIGSTLFVFFSVFIISDFRRSSLIPAAIFALILGLALNYLFGSVFHVDIP